MLGRRPACGADDGASTWLMRANQALARFTVEETLREDAAQAVRALRRDGVRVVLLSGDAPARVQRLSTTLGLDACHGGATPEAKLALLRAAQARGERVAMIGDGINDAPVLAQADVSLAMGEGAQIARMQADGVLLSNRLGDVVFRAPAGPPDAARRAPEPRLGRVLQRRLRAAGSARLAAALGRGPGHGAQLAGRGDELRAACALGGHGHPLSADPDVRAAVLAIIAVFGWALHGGQFDDLEQQGERILEPDAVDLDRYQSR